MKHSFQRPRDTQLRALFIENLSGPVLQMLGTKYLYSYLSFYSTAYQMMNTGLTLNHFSGPHPCTGFHHVFKKKSRKKSATVSLIWPRCWMIGFLFWRASYRHYNHPDLLTLNATIWCNTAIGEPINRQPAWWWCTHIVGFTIDWYACASHLTLQFVPYSIPPLPILTLISR